MSALDMVLPLLTDLQMERAKRVPRTSVHHAKDHGLCEAQRAADIRNLAVWLRTDSTLWDTSGIKIADRLDAMLGAAKEQRHG